MPSFGKTTDGTNVQTFSGDRIYLSTATPGSNGKVTNGKGRVRITATGSTKIKVVIFSDNAGEPDTFLAQSDEVTVDWTTSALTDFPFSGANQIDIVSGTPYWIGFWADDPGTPSYEYKRDNNANVNRYRAEAYPGSGSPTTPFVADGSSNGALNCSIEYNDSPTVDLNSPADEATTTDTTPTLDFTGTDTEGNDIRFELQLCDENDFYPVTPEILSSSQNSASSGSPNIDAPAGAQAGDKVIVIVTQNGQTTIADNNGSTPFTEDLADYQPNTSNGQTISVFSRTIQAGDPTTYNFTPGVTGRWAAIALRLKGGEYDVAPSSGNAANEDDSDDGSIDAPSINVGNNSIHIVVCTWDTSAIGTITTPSGYTLIQNANGGGNPLHASSKAFATGGATGAVTCQNSEFGAMIAFSFSVKSRTSLLLDKVSGTDAGFANPDNGGDTDPFNSGENIQYTVQAGDALSAGTYYWRVRSKDPSGSNVFGDWSLVRSFTITSGGTVYDKTVSETISHSETLLRDSVRTISESLTTTASNTSGILRTLLESITNSAVLSNVPIKVSSDAGSFSDALLRAPSKRIAESSTISEAITRAIIAIRSETISIVEALSKIFSRIFSEASTIVIALVSSKVTLATLSEVISHADSLIKTAVKNVSESQVVSDVFSGIKVALKSISEVITISESLVKSIVRVVGEFVSSTIFFLDTAIKTTTRTLSESSTFTETFSRVLIKLLSVVENISFVDTIQRVFRRILSEAASIADTIIAQKVLFPVYKKIRGLVSSVGIRGGISRTNKH